MKKKHITKLVEKARMLKQRGDAGGAYNSFLEASRLDSGNAQIWMELAGLCMHHGKADAALQFAESALRCDQSLARAYVIMGWAYTVKTIYEEAERSYGKAVNLEPGQVFARGGLADSLVKQGKYQRAYEVIKNHLTIASSGPGIAVAFSDIAIDLDRVEEATALLESLIDTKKYYGQEMIVMRFALGKLYDYSGEYERAFAHYAEGNKISPHNISIEKDRYLFDLLMQIFTREKCSRYPRGKQSLYRQVFILGMPRSGTSLVEQILSCHSDVHAGGEMQMIPDIATAMPGLIGSNAEFPFCMNALTGEAADRIVQQYDVMIGDIAEGQNVITDKLPHNFLMLGLISVLFPGAKIIHCTREPLDNCLSIYFQLFGVSNGFDANDMTTIAHHYNNYQELMRHWKEVCNLPIMDVSYEQLVHNQEDISRSMLEFCDLDWQDACLEFYKSSRVTRTASYDQVRRPIYKQSISRWKNYAEHIGPLRKVLHGV